MNRPTAHFGRCQGTTHLLCLLRGLQWVSLAATIINTSLHIMSYRRGPSSPASLEPPSALPESAQTVLDLRGLSPPARSYFDTVVP